MKDYAVGAFLGGLLVLAVLGRRSSSIRAQPRVPGIPGVSLPLAAAAAAALAPATTIMPRGIPPALADAIRRAPVRPDPGADRPDDAPVIALSPETAEALAADAVVRVPGLVLTAAETAAAMRSGARRVIFTAHAPAVPLSVKLVATFVRPETAWELAWLRPYSAVPDILDPLAGADMAAAAYACFRPVVTPGPC